MMHYPNRETFQVINSPAVAHLHPFQSTTWFPTTYQRRDALHVARVDASPRCDCLRVTRDYSPRAKIPEPDPLKNVLTPLMRSAHVEEKSYGHSTGVTLPSVT